MSGDVLRTLRAAHDEGHATGVEIEGLRAVPGWAVRAAAGVAALLIPVAAGLASARGPFAAVGDALVLAIGALVVVRPRTGWSAWLVLVAGLGVLVGDPVGPVRLAALLLVVHLAVVAALLAARVERGMRVEVAVPLGLLRRAVPFQLGAQAAGLVVWLLRPSAGVLPAGDVWRVAALVVAAVVVLVVLPRRRPR